MRKSLIIGGCGFVGKYLAEYLKRNGDQVFVTKLPYESFKTDEYEVSDLDILDAEKVLSLLNDIHPDVIYHLAAQSSVAQSWKNPGLTVDINIKGTLNILDSIRKLKYRPRILLVGSGEEYGRILPEEVPVGEETLLRPGNIYAVTKACQNMLGKIYADAYGMDIIMVRAFNHIGPGQSEQFVVSDFCKQVAALERNQAPSVIKVGNLKAKRDFTDVRDVVRAYALLMNRGKSGETYNVGSGKAVSIEEILKMIISFSQKEIQIEIEEKRFRPIDVMIIEANIGKLQACTNWRPEIEIERTIQETLDYWRKRK